MDLFGFFQPTEASWMLYQFQTNDSHDNYCKVECDACARRAALFLLVPVLYVASRAAERVTKHGLARMAATSY
jgi:hypothetical protein